MISNNTHAKWFIPIHLNVRFETRENSHLALKNKRYQQLWLGSIIEAVSKYRKAASEST